MRLVDPGYLSRPSEMTLRILSVLSDRLMRYVSTILYYCNNSS